MHSQRHAQRQNQLIQRFRAHNRDALPLAPRPNVYCFTGLSFHLSERAIVAVFPEDGRRAIVLPRLEAVKVVSANGMKAISYTDEAGHEAAFRHACHTLELGGSRLGAD
jgi:Xaa-Pro aminopeptidase